MKNKLNIFALTIFLSTSVIAEFSYNYVQLGYTFNDYKHDDNTKILSGSKEFDNGLLLLGGYSYMTADWNDPGEYEEKTVKTISVGVGRVVSLNSKTDFIASLMYSDYDSKQICTNTNGSDCTSSYSDGGVLKSDYYTVNLGVRHLIYSGLEVNAEYSLDRRGDLKPKTNIISVGVMKDIAKDIAIGLKALSYKKPDANEVEIYFRRNF